MLTLNDGRSELWQWDTNRKLTVDADCSQVHFSNKVFGRSIDVDVVDGVAEIPDILLQTDKDLSVWAFVGTAENGYTKISKVFKVNRRNKPADYVFTPPDQTTLEEIKEKIKHLESIQDPDAIKNAVDDYLANNPIKVQETDPTVPAWAKNEKKPTYTADEVGALSKEELSGAVNDALAQAKASGAFDGEPGAPGQDYVLTEDDKIEIAEMAAGLVEVPDSGGNVAYDEVQNLTDAQKAQARENIGAQPAGNYLTEVPEGYAKKDDIPTDEEIITLIEEHAPESSGGGIAVTGATVGQTVKISAVDENGVPTAWLPVDFPSGGGGAEKMRRIADITTTEDLQRISVSTDMNGNAFSLSKFAIHFYGSAKDAQGYLWIVVNGNKGVCKSQQMPVGDRNIQWFVELNNDGTYNACICGPLINSMIPANMGVILGEGGLFDGGPVGNSITSITIGTHQMIAAGAKIVIYGA